MPISTPTQIAVPFAASGLKNAIPAASDPVTGKAGYDQGFTAINMTPRTAGGIPPYGQDMNGIFFDISTALQFLEAGGSFPYSSVFSTAIGGYPLGALVSRTDGSGLWRNTVAGNTTNPEAFGVGWQPEDAGGTSVAMSNANVTLTALQAARSIITITGTLTANVQLILPTYIKQWFISNNASGAFTVTIKTAAGSGIVIGTSASQFVVGDGTNIVSGSGLGRLINTQIFTASGTYTPTQGMRICRVRGVGGGGGAAGLNPVVAGSYNIVGGGAAGSYSEGWFTSAQIGASKPVTIGAGGIAGTSGLNAGPGGATSLGALMVIPGGGGSIGVTTFTNTTGSISPGGAPGALPTGGSIVNARGQAGGFGMNTTSSGQAIAGVGGSGPLGSGGESSAFAATYNAGTGYGSGASGSFISGSFAGSPGIAGQPGVLIVEEYS